MKVREFFDLPKRDLMVYLYNRYNRNRVEGIEVSLTDSLKVLDFLGLDRTHIRRKIIKKDLPYSFYGICRINSVLVVLINEQARIEIKSDFREYSTDIALYFNDHVLSPFEANQEYRVGLGKISEAFRILGKGYDYAKTVSEPA